MKNLVIVESPNKIKSISKILGDDYIVKASVGHIAKLESYRGFGINFETWEPNYVLDSKKKKVVQELKKEVKNVEKIFIATDPDREGEAIANHLVYFLDLKDNYNRIRFNEITSQAIIKSIENPSKIDQDLVNSQKARRILDRIIGFSLSSLLKSKIWNAPVNPSAGRVQSVALKIVIDREKEIEKFIPIPYFNVNFDLYDEEKNQYNIVLSLKSKKENKDRLDEKQILAFKNLQVKNLVFNNIKKTIKSDKTFSPLKQAIAYRKFFANFNLSASKSERILQYLYEIGAITYPRTDSTRISDVFLNKAKSFLKNKYGEEYISNQIKGFKGDQDAHEAIRPSDINLSPQEFKNKYQDDLMKKDHYGFQKYFDVYKFIYQTTIKSILKPPKNELTHFEFIIPESKLYNLSFVTSKIVFLGYNIIEPHKNETKQNFPNFVINNSYKIIKTNIIEKATKPPSRFNDGSLIKKLDEIGVGRPSTFAQTIRIIKKRLYVENKNKAMLPTSFGKIVIDKLMLFFKKFIEEKYTSKMENKLDLISKGDFDYKNILEDFWNDFKKELDEGKDKMEKTILDKPKALPYDLKKCPNCQSDLLIRTNRKNGEKFIGCSKFPKCRFAEPLDKKEDIKK